MKIKRVLAALLAFVLVFNILPPISFAENPVFTIAGEDTTVEIGAKAMVNINMSNNTGFSVLNLYYTYNEDYFTLTEVKNKAWPLIMTHDKTTVWDASTNYEADGTLATLVFDVAEDTPYGEYEIGIHLISAANADLEYVEPVTVNATVTVTPIKVKGVDIYNPDVSLDIGATEQLIANVTPENAANKSVTWRSEDTSVATVDQNGLVTGVAYGTTEIVVTTNDGGYTDRCKVSVNCNHSYDSKVIAPTYLEHGYTLYTCSICEHSYSDHFVDPLERTPIEQADISLEYNEAFYEGKPLEPQVYISYQGQQLDAATELKITYGGNNGVGVATVVVEGINRFTGTVTLTFSVSYEVIPEKIVNVSAISDYGKILLSWGRSSEVATDTYRIYRAAEGQEKYVLIKTIRGRDNVTYEDKTVKKGVSYTYYVTGVGAYGAESEPSVVAGATALVDMTPPVVLKLVPADNIILSGTTTFSAVAEDNVGVNRGYYEYSLDGEHWTEIGTTYDSGLSIRFTVDFATDVTVMQVRLTVYDAEGNASAPKIAKYVIDNVGPDKVTGLAATSLSSKLTLSWNDVAAADAQYFILQQQTDSGWTTVASNITTLGYTLTNLTPGTTYAYRVACVDVRGNVGEYSDVFYAKTSADTTAPVITDQGPASARYNHSFTFYATARDDSDIRYIYFEVSTDLTHWEMVERVEYTVAAPKQEYSSVIDLTNRAEGSLYVRAIAEDFAGNRSSTDASAPYSEYIVDKTAPAAPDNVTANGKNGYISIFWTMGKESDINTYRVYRSLSADGEYTPVSSPLTAVSYHDTAVEDGVTYFYKVVVSDRAGNISEYSSAVSAAMTGDTQKPEITGIGATPNQKFGPKVNTISVSAGDNNNLNYLLVEYCTNRDLTYRELIKTENIAAPYVNTQVTLPIADLTDGDVVHIRVSAMDMAGLSSGYAMSKFTYDSTAPAITDLTVTITDNKATLNWNSSGEEDLSGFKVYRSSDGVTYTLLGSRAPRAGAGYTFIDTITEKQSATFTYKVEAVDVLQNAASLTATADYVYVHKNTPPTAVIDGPAYMMVDSEELFDASASKDDVSIKSYYWEFGDGTTSNQQKPIKKYAKAGTYTITLTVTDNGGLTHTQTMTMVVNERETLGVLNVVVLDENNNPVPYVPVYFDLGSDNQRIVNTNGSGMATMKLSQGTHVVGMYSAGYLPVKKDVVVLQNATRTVTLTTVKEELVTGEFEITRMSFDEIVAAGIDVYDPANRNVYSATVRVSYGSTPPIRVSYVRNDTKILDYKIYDYSGEPVDEYVNENGETRHIAGVKYIGGGIGGGGGSADTDIIAIIDIPAAASYLKEFFDVKLHIINNASPDFSLEKNTVTLNVPDGMTLMSSVTGGYLTSATAEIDSIRGQESKTLAWVLRGDKTGEYDLSADFTGTLSLFNAPVNARFETDTPIKVYGLEGVTFRVLTASEIHNETLYFNIELENNRDIDIYAPAAGLTDKIKNVTESVLNQNPDGDFYVQSHVLNVYIANENGAKQYIPFTFDANNNAIVKVDVLAPGQKIVYEYVAYNAIDYDGIAYFKEAVVKEFEGLAKNIEVGSFEKQRYSFIDYSEKLDVILSGADNETVRGYQHLLDSDDFYYSSVTGGYFADQCEKMYKSASLILNFDFGVLTQEEERQLIQAIILTILSDSSVVSQSEDLLMMKYSEAISGMVDTIRDGMVKTFNDSESSVKDITDACADILKDKRELAIVYRTEGREAFLEELNKRMAGYALGITVDVIDYLSPAQESACFSDVFGDVKDVVGAFFNAVSETEREAYYYAILKKQCDSQISSTILYALRDILQEQLLKELDQAIMEKLLSPGSSIMNLPDIGLGANTLAYQTVELMITQLENDLDTFYEDVNLYVNLLKEAGELAATKVLQKVFATAIGSTTFGVISAAFNIADAIFGFGDYVKQQDTFDIYGALSEAFLKAHLNSIQTRGSNADFYSMLYLRALCEMRLSGEAQYKKFMSDYIDGVYFRPVDEDIVLLYINMVKGTSYTSYDKWGDDLQYSVVRPRDLIFNIEYTEVNIPRAPVVSLNYETLQTEQSFTSDYEYCFADGEWKPCDGNPISFEVGSVPSVIRVRKAAGDENLAGEITTVKIFAQKELSKLIKVKFDGVNYILEGLSSEYHYQILFTDELDAQPDWSMAKIISGGENVLKGVGKAEYVIIRSCQNAPKGETASLPLTLTVASKSPLNLVIEGNGTVSQSGVNGCYYNGEEIDLIATPNDYDEFIGWYVNGTLVSSDRYYIAEMAENMQVTARFGGKTIAGVEITNPPKKITYYEGETLDLNGLELTINYANAAPVMYKLRSATRQNTGGDQDIAEQYTAYLVSNTAGTATVVVNYGGQIATFEIEIRHDTIEYVKQEATCGADGVYATYCTLCQEVIKEEPIPATGDHDYKWIVDSEATCGVAGTQHEECTVCHDTRNENTSIPATGEHTYDDVYDTSCNGCDHVRTVESVSVTTNPGKLSYLEAKDTLDVTGGKLQVTYDDGVIFELDMTKEMVSGFDNTVVGEQKLLVTYGGKTANYTVTVIAKTLTSIEVTTKPTKLTYIESTKLDDAGMVLTLRYDNDTTETVTTGWTNTYDFSQVGGTKVTVTYGGKTTTYDVTVVAKQLASIEVTTKPTKLTYIESTKLDDAGMVLTLRYDNDTTETVTTGWTNTYDFSQVGGTKVTVTYGGKTTTYDVTVVAKQLASIEVTTKPTKLTYIESTKLDDAGMVLTLHYDNDTTETVTTGWTNSYDFSQVGGTKVTVTYGGKTTTYDVTVVAKQLASIEVTTKPTKLTYIESTKLDDAGMALTLRYDNDTTETVTTGWTSSYDFSQVGGTKVTVTYGGKTTTYDVTVVAKQLVSIEVTTKPTKLTYIESTKLDDAGMVLTLHYDNDTTETVTTGWTNSYDFSQVGGTKVTVTYGGKTTTYDVTVVAKQLTSIEVTTKPTKLTYIESTKLDDAGMVLTLHYDNDTTETVTTGWTNSYDFSKVGGTKVTVTYGGKTTTYDVTVVAKQLTSIEVTTKPTKLTYIESTKLDDAGMVLTLHYDNDTTETVTTGWTNSYDFSQVGGTKVTVTYGGKTTTYDVTVVAKQLVSIAVTTKPSKTEYLEAKDTLNLAGGKLTLSFDNDTTEEIDLSEAEVTGFNNLVVGDNTLTVTYGGKTTTFTVKIKAKTLTSIAVTTKPTKLNYIEGNAFDTTGMVVTAYYDNDTSEVVTGYTVEGYDATPGTKTIKVTYGGKTATFTVEVVEKTLTSIAVTTKPTKTEYLEAKDTLNLAGGKLTLSYDNDTTEEIDLSEAEVTGFNNLVVGDNTLTVTYGGKTTTFIVKIKDKTLTSIAVTTKPTKLNYIEGNALDTTGMVVTAYYDNDTSEVVTGYTVEGYDATPGTKTIKVTYNGMIATFTVEVAKKSLTHITVSKLPTKLTYIESTKLDDVGMVLTLHYDNDTTETVTTGWTNTYDFSQVGGTKVTVTYGGKTTTYDVTVIAKQLTSIEVTTKPTKLNYIEGNAFDTTGMVVTAYYDNDTSEVVTGYAVEGYDATPGTKTIKVTYGGKAATFTVEVAVKSLTSIAVTTQPTKTEYLEAKDTLNLAGGKLTLSFDNDTTESVDLSEAEVTGFNNLVVGDNTLTVTYGGKTTTFTVKIKAKTLTSIAVTTKPTKLNYIEGNAFDTTGMVVTAYYDNDTNAAVTGYTVEGYDATPGTKTIKVTYGGKAATFTVEVAQKTLISIAVTTRPTKTEYLEAKDTLNLAGGKLTLSYDNDTTEEIDLSEAEVTGFNNLVVGDNTLTVTYGGKTTTFTVKIKAKTLSSIKVTTKPSKLTYLEGDVFDATGMVVTAYYNNDTSAVITGYAVSGYATTPGTKNVTVTYEGKTDAFEVTVRAKSVTAIELTTKPTKLSYVESTILDDTGMVLTVYYDNNTHEELTTGWTSEYDFSQIGETTVTVTYGGKTVTYGVTVVAKTMTHIEVTVKPNKLVYTEGDTFDSTGMVVTAYYDNGTSETVGNYTVTGYDSTIGAKTITVTYEGKTTIFTVTVKSRVPSQITSSEYTVSGESISKITTGTTVGSLLAGVGEKEFCKVYKGDTVVSDSAPIGTGMVVKIMDGETVKATYTVIVTGDTNGDGNTSITDMIAIKAHLLQKTMLSGAYAAAANTNGDSGISITDFIQVKAQILGKGTIVPK